MSSAPYLLFVTRFLFSFIIFPCLYLCACNVLMHILSRFLVTMTWRVFRLLVEETAIRCGWWLSIHWMSSRGQRTRGDPTACQLSLGTNNSSP